MSDRIQYRYDSLEDFARRFSDHASETEQVRSRLNKQLAVLEQGGWLGEGAKRFSTEMRESILPALDALAHALDSANAGVMRAAEMMRAAEAEAASLFRNVELAEAGQTAGSSQPIDDGQRAQQIAILSGLRDEQTTFIQELRRGMETLGGQLASVQDAYDRLMSEAASRAERMTALIRTMQGGAM